MDERELELEETLQNSSDEFQSQNETDSSSTSADDESIKAELEKLRKINSQLYARLKKAEEKLKNPEKQVVNNQAVYDEDKWRKKMEFIISYGKDLDREQLEEVIAYAEGKNIPYEKALESPFVKAALEKIQEIKRTEMAKVDVESSKSDIEKKFTIEQLKNMPLDELEKLIKK